MAEFRVTGIEDTVRSLRRLGEEGERAASREIEATALDVQGDAKKLLTSQGAVDTGRLRNSVTVAPTDSELARLSAQATGGEPGSDGGTDAPTMVVPGMMSAYIGTNVEYAREIEFGRGGRGARPYLTPALEGRRAQFRRRLETALKRLRST